MGWEKGRYYTRSRKVDGRVEPRVNKRRPKLLALMKKPRHQLQAELEAAA